MSAVLLRASRELRARTPSLLALALVVGIARYGTIIDRPKVLEGRMPRPESLDEMAVGFVYAKQHHLRVGGRLTLGFLPSNPYAPPIDVALRIVGIEASPGEFPPQLS